MSKPETGFWILAPFFVVFLVAMPFLWQDRSPKSLALLVAVELCVACALLGFYDALRFRWALRASGAIILLGIAWRLTIPPDQPQPQGAPAVVAAPAAPGAAGLFQRWGPAVIFLAITAPFLFRNRRKLPADPSAEFLPSMEDDESA